MRPARWTTPGSRTDSIKVRDLRVQARIGVTAEERATAQTLLVDLDVYADLTEAAVSDDVGNTIDYDALVSSVEDLARSSACRLLENLAARIAESVADDPLVQGVVIEIGKEKPPVSQDVGSISVRLERWAK